MGRKRVGGGRHQGMSRGFLLPWCEQREKNMRAGEAGDEAAGGKEVLPSNTK